MELLKNRQFTIVGFVAVVVVVIVGFLMLGGDDETETAGGDASYTIGTLNFTPELALIVDGFLAEMTELGYVEGENVTYVSETTGDPTEQAALVQKVLDANPDLIMVGGTDEALAIRAINTEVPIIFGVSTDPIGAGLADDLQQPGNNITGITAIEFGQRRLQLLLDIDPTIKKIFVPYNPNDVGPAKMIEAIQEAAADLDVEIVAIEVNDADEVADAIANIPEDADAIFLGPDGLVFSQLGSFIGASLQNQLALSVPTTQIPPEILMGYGLNPPANGAQAARLADQVLKGADAGSLPIENSEYALAISLPGAEALGLELPDTLLQQADFIIRGDEG